MDEAAQGLEQVAEVACSMPGCGKVSAEEITEVVNDRPDIMEAVTDAVMENDKHLREAHTG